jgi:2-polyprenyl-3-methyl-5-hydroxy-6-metoxy-1,4-benzoquinol methylase
MALGPFVRRMLGPTLARIIGSAYRSVFVNLDHVVEALVAHIPDNAEVLDIGGGDGELLNRLLRCRSNVRVIMIDISPKVGAFLDPELMSRVTLRPSTTLKDYLNEGKQVNCIMINDALHHIPKNDRDQFLREVHAGLKPGGKLIIKEFAPGGLRSLLGLLADRYISGDRKVSLIKSQELESLVRRNIPVQTCEESSLYKIDRPNYAFIFGLKSISKL